jgi:hypothetical protein
VAGVDTARFGYFAITELGDGLVAAHVHDQRGRTESGPTENSTWIPGMTAADWQSRREIRTDTSRKDPSAVSRRAAGSVSLRVLQARGVL